MELERFSSIEKNLEHLHQELNLRWESVLKEVTIRLEAQQKEMKTSFEAQQKQIDTRFDAIDKRFIEMDKRFKQLLWTIGTGFSFISILTTLTSLILKFY